MDTKCVLCGAKRGTYLSAWTGKWACDKAAPCKARAARLAAKAAR